MEDKNYFSQFACTFISGDKNVLFLVQGRRPSHGKFYDMLSGRKGEGGASCTSCVSSAFSSK